MLGVEKGGAAESTPPETHLNPLPRAALRPLWPLLVPSEAFLREHGMLTPKATNIPKWWPTGVEFKSL